MKIVRLSALALVAALLAACDKVPLLAPVGSTITLSANSTTVPVGGSVGLTAFVTESSGTPVQNGTAVRFTTTLGTVTPSEAQTTNGIAVATFQAGSASGVAEVHAISGGAAGTSGSGSSATTTNIVKITVGAAAVNTISVTATPTSVSPNGGTTQIIASVFDTNGGSLQGIPVNFSSDQGSVAPSSAVTDANGQATTTLTTSVETTVTATAGTKNATVKVTARAAPGISITCAPASGSGTCASLTPGAGNTATVTFTIKKASGTSTLRDVTVNFGDGTSQGVGNLAGGDAVVTHTYSGPGSSSPAVYTATATATDVNGERASASTSVVLNPRGAMTVSITATRGSESGGKVTYTLTANVSPTSTEVSEYTWDFGDGQTTTTSSGTIQHVYTIGSGITNVKVTAKASDGRTASGETQINP